MVQPSEELPNIESLALESAPPAQSELYRIASMCKVSF